MKLRAQLSIYQEKEAVKAATAASVGNETLTTATLKQSQALLLQLAHSLAVPLPDMDKCSVAPKPTAPTLRGPDWNVVSETDPVLLQAATQQVEAEETARPLREKEEQHFRE